MGFNTDGCPDSVKEPGENERKKSGKIDMSQTASEPRIANTMLLVYSGCTTEVEGLS